METENGIGPGTLLGDRYFIHRAAWTSPLGPVWVARDRVLDRAVYVQTLSGERGADAEAVRAFRRAAARAAQFTHPALLRVYDIGEKPPFVVFELPPGGRLADRLRAGPLALVEASGIALALARGLEALHERGAWHGALSPATVFLDEEGRPKLAGGGMSDVLAEEGHPVQPPSYRPPEADPAPSEADRYALAALTYHMVTGRSPGPRPEPPRQIRRSLPKALDELLGAALASDPSARPSLDRLMGGLAPLARPEPPEVREPAFVRSSEFRWLVPVAFIVVLGGLAVFFGLRLDLSEPGAGGPEPTRASPAAYEVREVRDFDPEPQGNGEENPRLVSRVVDGDARTDWKTLGYLTADLGGLKEGVGLLFDLGEPREVGALRVQSTLPGWQAEWRAADEAAEQADGYRTVATFTASEDRTVTPREPVRARYFLLWITRLVDDDSGSEFPFRAFVAEVELMRSAEAAAAPAPGRAGG